MASFFGSTNIDLLTGSSGNDTFFFDSNEYQPLDTADGGDGVDLLAFNGSMNLGLNDWHLGFVDIEELAFSGGVHNVTLSQDFIDRATLGASQIFNIAMGGTGSVLNLTNVSSWGATGRFVVTITASATVSLGDVNLTYNGSDEGDLLFLGLGHNIVELGTGLDLVYGDLDEIDGDDITGDANTSGTAIDQLIISGAGEAELTAGHIDIRLDDGANDFKIIIQNHVQVTGGSGDDEIELIGTGNETSLVYGNDGTDNITGGFSNDEIYGGDGIDALIGGAGNDILDGGAEGDLLNGGLGDDIYQNVGAGDIIVEGADQGTDEVTTALNTFTLDNLSRANIENLTFTGSGLFTGTGNDRNNIITAGDDGSVINLSDGDDTGEGGGGDDIINAGSGSDTLRGRNGEDILNGGIGNDFLFGGNNDDILQGGENDDELTGGGGADTLDGGDGIDWALYRSAQAAVDIDLSRATNQAQTTSGNDQLSNIENVEGGDFSDTLRGDGNANHLIGGEGADVLSDGGGADTLEGGIGADQFTLDFDLFHDHVDGGIGDDDRMAFGGSAHSVAAYFDSSPSTGALQVVVRGVLGNGEVYVADTVENVEFFYGSGFGDDLSGFQHMFGQGGNDGFTYDSQTDTYDGGTGSDTLTHWGFSAMVIDLSDSSANTGNYAGKTITDIENLTNTGTHNDQLLGNGEDNELRASGGQDLLRGRDGNDELFGGSDDDELWGGNDDDWLNGGSGADEIRGGMGTDTADYTGSTAGVVVNLGTGNISGGDAEGDTLFSIENLMGSSHADDLLGDDEANRLEGGAGEDRLNGMEGADTMLGGADNDLYRVDDAGDVVSELTDEGDDIVDTFVSYNVPVNVEVLRMLGTDDINSTGTAERDQIYGNDGKNIIDGGGGFDVMAGGAGDDVYSVDNSLDAVIEASGGGFDNVYSSVDYILDSAQEIESAILTGSAVVLRGDNSDNQLFGNDNVNVLEGKGGTDYLLGLGGDDIFQVSLEANATDLDVFGDFEGAGVAGGDRIALDASIWGTDGIVYQVSQTSFIVATAQNTNQQQFIIANLTTPQTDLIAGDDYYFG